jgi:hypothetical protein
MKVRYGTKQSLRWVACGDFDPASVGALFWVLVFVKGPSRRGDRRPL